MTRLILFLFFAPILLSAQNNNKCEPAMPFSKIQIYDGIIASLEKGEENQLCPGANTEIENLNITSSDGVLKIRKVSGRKYEKTPQIRIIYKEITSIGGYGKAEIDTRNLIKCDSIDVTLRSGAKLYADFDVKHLVFMASEGSLMKAKGYAIKQNINVSVKATFSGFELEGNEGVVKATTGGTAKVNLEKKLNANANTGGQVRYKGTPSMETKTGMGGKIINDTEE